MMVIVHHFVISPLLPPTIVKYMLLGNFNVNNSSSRLILVNYDSDSLTEESPASLGYLVAESASKRLKVTIGRVSEARSSFLTVMAVMTGGTQLIEWAHLTGGDTRFCCESSKSREFYDRGSENTTPCRK